MNNKFKLVQESLTLFENDNLLEKLANKLIEIHKGVSIIKDNILSLTAKKKERTRR